MRFCQAVEATRELRGAYRQGLQALKEADRNRILYADSRRLKGSVNVEAHLSGRYPNAALWDYGIGWLDDPQTECAIWAEVHPASAGLNIGQMLGKAAWLKDWLRKHAPSLNKLTRSEDGFVWIASGAISFRQGTPQAMKLAKAGVSFPQKILRLN